MKKAYILCVSVILFYKTCFEFIYLYFHSFFYFLFLSLSSTKTHYVTCSRKSTQACLRYRAAQVKSRPYIHSERLTNLLCNARWWMFQDAGGEYLQQAQMMSKEIIFTTRTESGVSPSRCREWEITARNVDARWLNRKIEKAQTLHQKWVGNILINPCQSAVLQVISFTLRCHQIGRGEKAPKLHIHNQAILQGSVWRFR